MGCKHNSLARSWIAKRLRDELKTVKADTRSK